MNINDILTESYFSDYERNQQRQMDANRRYALNREREENDAIDARLRAQYAARKEYEQSGKFWLKLKDTQRHLPAGPFTGKAEATTAAIELLKKQPELQGNLVITAWGPDEKPGMAEGKKPNHLNPGWMLKVDPELAKKVKANTDRAKAKARAMGNPAAGKSAEQGDVRHENKQLDLAEDDINPADVGEYDREGDMAIGQLKTIEDAAAELRSILDAEDNLPEWVQSKITNAVDYIDTVRDYMKSKDSESVEEGKTGPGLWANIHAKRERIKGGSGERMRKPGSKGAPTAQDFKDAASEGAAEGVRKLSIQQLATISDEALDKAYGYGRSSPGNTFGWQANLKSAEYAAKMINAGITDIEKISDAIHKGWNVTAKAFVQNPDQFDDTAKLKDAGKLEAKLQQRAKLMNIGYTQLPDDEQEKDRVVARALLQAIKGGQEVTESEYQSQYKSKEQAIKYAKDRVKTFRDPEDGIEIWAMPDGGFDVVATMNSNGRNHCVTNGGKKLGTIGARHQGVAEGKEDKIAQLKQDYATAVHWSKNETSPQKREAARQKAEKIKRHLETQYKQGVAEGWKVVQGIDREKYVERPGLEGPFATKSGKVVYYDKREGKYYDPDTDMYIEYDDWQAMNESQQQDHITAMIAECEERAGTTSSPIKRNHLLRMAQELREQLKSSD